MAPRPRERPARASTPGQLRADARPADLRVGDADEFVNGDYTTCVEETGNGATLLAHGGRSSMGRAAPGRTTSSPRRACRRGRS